ncbi:MAG: class I SAM-dependent methyltransferase [Candidatus Omnitrophica bacterium]|nr:class I SAM-dependent methyltransferase [Candidatus Omnitrophota bacterium]
MGKVKGELPAGVKEKIKFLSDPAGYNMAEEWYEIAREDHFWVRLRFAILRKIAAENVFTGRVLDVGCGHGVSREQIEEHYHCAVDGCDLNLAALSRAVAGRGDLLFYNVRNRTEELKEGFSAVVLFDVLEHVPDPVEFLRSVGFHLGNEGRLIINVPALQMLFSKYDLAAGHIKRYALSSLKRELAEAGFEIEKATYWGVVFIPLLLVRRLALRFVPKEKIIQTGFRPGGRFSAFILESLSRLERMLPMQPIAGTSLMVIARKIKRKG